MYKNKYFWNEAWNGWFLYSKNIICSWRKNTYVVEILIFQEIFSNFLQVSRFTSFTKFFQDLAVDEELLLLRLLVAFGRELEVQLPCLPQVRLRKTDF